MIDCYFPKQEKRGDREKLRLDRVLEIVTNAKDHVLPETDTAFSDNLKVIAEKGTYEKFMLSIFLFVVLLSLSSSSSSLVFDVQPFIVSLFVDLDHFT